jgi:hypothetical protein
MRAIVTSKHKNSTFKNGTSADHQLATYRKAIVDGDSERKALLKVTDRLIGAETRQGF